MGERKQIMKRIEIERDSWDRGYADGRDGKLAPPGFGDLSFWSGYIEGKAERERTKCHLFVPEDCQ